MKHVGQHSLGSVWFVCSSGVLVTGRDTGLGSEWECMWHAKVCCVCSCLRVEHCGVFANRQLKVDTGCALNVALKVLVQS